MKVITLKAFDNKANIAFNDAFNIANQYNCNEVSSIHLLVSMLRNNKVAELFRRDTGLTAIKFKEVALNLLKSRDKSNDINREYGEELTIDSLTEELHMILGIVIDKENRRNKLVSIVSLYKETIRYEDALVWEVLQLMGVDKEETINSMENPLENMPATAQFAVDYNLLAKEGRFDPIEARDDVIESTFEVLGRRIKNNPCLVGEAGVGKTAIVEGMAQRLLTGNVPNYLKGKHIISVDISGIVSGSKYRGDFEERLNSVLYEASTNKNVILFFDEFHMLADAGGNNADSAMTAANIIKPAISRGDVQIIGATTFNEYKKFIERDKAFERRMQMVQVSEPNVDAAILMIKAVIKEYDKFHNSNTSEEAIKAAVVMSDRYITDKKLPDKAITVIDETAARLKKFTGAEFKIDITVNDIKKTISKLTGIDIEDLDEKSRNKIKSLQSSLARHVIGQDTAIESVSKAIARSKAGIKDPNRPIGSFLFVGPTGVGKTELSKALAIEFSGGIKNLIRFDMSEFMEKHSVSKLIGSPPGYVGYGDGGQLTEAVRHNPYSIILFDEIEKAHPDIFNILLQVLDDGILTDSEGTVVDFKNTILIMTSNAGYGADRFNKGTIGFSTIKNNSDSDNDNQEKIALKALEETFRPEFLNRLDKVVIFNKLSQEDIKSITVLLLNKLKSRLSESNKELTWDTSVIDFISEAGFSEKYGARNIKRKIQEVIEDDLADRIISEEIKEGDSITLSYKDGLEVKIKHSIGKELNIDKELISDSVAYRGI